ncbi:hypothetical protein SAMD00023353_0500390 [Rosellinia necatrix]|uniref:Uncharacterized protein n=1 Tax=Rosellinia necatrix TaxID=77044 RepID=A0A1S7UK60_ROSNE|nr:hypothetical protein SAMD00023353_0500390 [Rosellinia necatrix]
MDNQASQAEGNFGSKFLPNPNLNYFYPPFNGDAALMSPPPEYTEPNYYLNDVQYRSAASRTGPYGGGFYDVPCYDTACLDPALLAPGTSEPQTSESSNFDPNQTAFAGFPKFSDDVSFLASQSQVELASTRLEEGQNAPLYIPPSDYSFEMNTPPRNDSSVRKQWEVASENARQTDTFGQYSMGNCFVGQHPPPKPEPWQINHSRDQRLSPLLDTQLNGRGRAARPYPRNTHQKNDPVNTQPNRHDNVGSRTPVSQKEVVSNTRKLRKVATRKSKRVNTSGQNSTGNCHVEQRPLPELQPQQKDHPNGQRLSPLPDTQLNGRGCAAQPYPGNTYQENDPVNTQPDCHDDVGRRTPVSKMEVVSSTRRLRKVATRKSKQVNTSGQNSTGNCHVEQRPLPEPPLPGQKRSLRQPTEAPNASHIIPLEPNNHEALLSPLNMFRKVVTQGSGWEVDIEMAEVRRTCQVPNCDEVFPNQRSYNTHMKK